MDEINNKIIELRNYLNEFLLSQDVSMQNIGLEKTTSRDDALKKINKIIDIINLGFYNDKDCLNEIIKILNE